MGVTSKLLGQQAPSATTTTDLYTVPANTQAQLIVNITNRNSASATFRVAVGTNGAGSLSNEDYIDYDLALDGNRSYHTPVLYLNAGDIVTVYASTANLSFIATGLEIT